MERPASHYQSTSLPSLSFDLHEANGEDWPTQALLMGLDFFFLMFSQAKRCDKKSLLTIRTECKSCSLNFGMKCPDGYTKITNGTIGIRDCRYPLWENMCAGVLELKGLWTRIEASQLKNYKAFPWFSLTLRLHWTQTSVTYNYDLESKKYTTIHVFIQNCTKIFCLHLALLYFENLGFVSFGKGSSQNMLKALGLIVILQTSYAHWY